MKIDLHVHTKEISLCAHVSAEETVRMYKEAGYGAIVITNHFSNDGVYHFSHNGRDDYYDAFVEGYELARAEGERIGLTVLLGFELRFDHSVNDYLVYGMPEDIGRDYARIFKMGPRDFSGIAKERDFLFYQAHPFRNHISVVNPEYLFGIEVNNANPRHDARNDIASAWADKFALAKIGGSDFHQREDIARGGIETNEDVRTIDDLVRVLKSGNYTVI